MKVGIFFLIFGIIGSLSGQVTDSQGCLIDSLSGGMIKRTCFNDNGTIGSVLFTIHGIEHGEYINYDSLGRITLKINYLNGKEIGTSYTNIYEYGIFCETRNKRDGSSCSLCRYENGRKMEQSKSNTNHETVGSFKRWHMNGRKSLKMVQGRGKAKYKTFYENGKKAEVGYIFDSPFAKVGIWKYYDENGGLKLVENYSHEHANVKDGTWKFYKDGKLIKTEEYRNDVIIFSELN